MDWGTIAWSCLGIGVSLVEVAATEPRPDRPVSRIESNKAMAESVESSAGPPASSELPKGPALKAYEVDILHGLHEWRDTYLLDAPSETHFILSRPRCPLFPEGWSAFGKRDLFTDVYWRSLSDRCDLQSSPPQVKQLRYTLTR